MSLNPYTVLDLSSTATAAEIKAAYKRLAFQYHPDRNRGSAYHTQRFQQIVEAYDILSDPDKKARFDRRFATSYSHTQAPDSAGNRSQQGPSAYGNRFTGYDPLRGRGRAAEAPKATYTGKGGRRYLYPSSHQIFIGVTLTACLVMVGFWLSAVMDRQAAKQMLVEGSPLNALEFDSTYGEAWFELGRLQAEAGMYTLGLRNMDHGIRLADNTHANWPWMHGRLAERVGRKDQAAADYRSLLRWQQPDSIPDELKDSLRIRLASLMLYEENRNDSAFALVSTVTDRSARLPSVQYLRGIAALRSGYYGESVRSLQAAADAQYYPGLSYYHLGFAFLATADSLDACKAWDIALTSGYERSDSVMRRYCTFGGHTLAPQPLVIYVKP